MKTLLKITLNLFFLIASSTFILANLISNGNFSQGNTGFTSDYQYEPGSGFGVGKYVITDNPQKHHAGFVKCSDHTNDSAKLMMVIDSYTTSNKVVWRQTVQVEKNTLYEFKMWATKLVYYDDSYLEIRFNGVPLDSIFHVTHSSGTWSDFHRSWCSGDKSSATIEIVNLTTASRGNDLAFDDFSLMEGASCDDIEIEKAEDVVICPSESKKIGNYSNPNLEYSWSPSTYLSNANIADPICTPNKSISYIVTISNGNCCKFFDTINVTVVNPTPLNIKASSILICKKGSVTLTANDGYSSYYWSNGKRDKQIIVAEEGIYSVLVKDSNGCEQKVSINIELKPTDTLKILGDDFICAGDSALIFVDGNYNDILWSNGKSTKNIYVTKPGKYDVICYDINGCEFVGSKELFAMKDTNNQIIGPDSVCNNDKYTLSLINGAKTYKWSNGSTAAIINAKGPGKFIVECTYEDACNTLDTIDVASLYPPIDVKILGKDAICKNDSTYIYVTDLFKKYTWSNGVKDTGMYVNKAGIYEIFCLDSNGCEHTGKIQVFDKKPTYNEIIAPDSVCINESYSLKLKYAPKTVKWSTGSEDMIIYAKGPGKFYVECTYFNDDCDSYDSIEVFLKAPINDLKIIGPKDICANDSAYILVSKIYQSYKWSNGSEEKGIFVNVGGTYTVTCIDENGCEHIGKIDITVSEVIPNKIIGPDSVCVGENYKLQTMNIAQKYNWSNGGTSRLINVIGPGKYYVECVYQNGCKTYDSIEVFAKEPVKDIVINGDNYFCENDSVYISVDIDRELVWSNGQKSKGIYVVEEGKYFVTYIDASGCEHIGTYEVSMIKSPKPEIIGPDTVCADESYNLDLKAEANEYFWSNGAKTKSITCTGPGTYIVECKYECDCKTYDTITVYGKPNVILNFNKMNFDFGDICRFSDNEFTLEITNPDDKIYQIDKISISNNDAEITFADNIQFPYLLNKGKINLKINMDLGLENGLKYDTIRVYSYEQCKSVYEIYLKWRIIDGYAKVSLIDTLVAAGDYLCYPIYYESECKSKEKLMMNYELEFDINKKVFKPEMVTSGVMSITRVTDDYNRVRIRDQYDVSRPNGIINYVCGTVLLADSSVNHIDISSFKFNEFTNNTIEFDNGTIKLIECLITLRQFNIIKPTTFSINPNISDDFTKIHLTSFEVGTFTFEVFDYTGNLVDSFKLNRSSKSDTEELYHDLRLDNKTQGAYFIKMTAPWTSITKSLIIVK